VTAESPKTSKKRISRSTIGIAIVAVIVIIIIAAFLSLSVDPMLPAEPGSHYPYTTTYEVRIPDGQPVKIAGTPILVLTAGDDLIMKIGDTSEQFVIGQTKTISERRAAFRVLGIKLLSTNYKIDATYLGRSDNYAEFYLIIQTSGQVPSFLIERILPGEIHAHPA